MDIHLHYEKKGQGRPLILLHGNGEDSTYFVNQIEYFSRWYRVIAVDTRGHGKSPRGIRPFTIRQFAEDLYNFMEEHRIERANILGFSDGGNIALLFTAKYPEKVERLIVNGANLNGRGVKPSVQIPVVLGYRMALLFAKKSEQARKKAEILGLMVNDPNIEEEQLEQILTRTLVIAGTNDMIKDSHTRLIFEKFPNAELVLLPGDHFIANKNPQEFNRAVEQFLQR